MEEIKDKEPSTTQTSGVPLKRLVSWVLRRYIIVPNPLFLAVKYGVILPKIYMMRAYHIVVPKTKDRNFCQSCGEDIGDSLWGWCSTECLHKMVS